MLKQTSVKYRAEISARESGYREGRDGTLRPGPGKFEGEPWYAPYFNDAWLNGDGEDCDGPEGCFGTMFHVDADEAEAFGLQCGEWVLLREDSQGFVFVTVHPDRDTAEKKFREWVGE